MVALRIIVAVVAYLPLSLTASSANAGQAMENSGHNATGASGGQDYQQYMKQYAGKYTGAGGYQKYMSQYTGGNSSGASSGQDYQKYMHQYADKYMGDKNATMLNAKGHGGENSTGASGGQDYQQYMKQYAGKYTGSGGASGGYQKYMSQYADNYMGGGDTSSGQDYQKYMQQYAGKYMGDKNATMLNAMGHGGENSTGASGGQDYQQYMKQYAGKYTGAGGYQKYMSQYAGGNSSGASSGQDYQKYMQQYAGKYMGDQNATMLNANTAGASGGQDYQQYMKQYAGKYMGAGGYQKYMSQYGGGNSSGQGYQKYISQYAGQAGPVSLFSMAQPTDCDTWRCLCAWRDNQTQMLKHNVPGQYSSYAIDNIEKEYGTHLAAFAANLSTSIKELGVSSQCRPKAEEESAPARPEAATTVAQLKAWRKQQVDNMDKFVPSGFRHFAKENVENDYKKNLDRLKGQAGDEEAPAKAEEAAPATKAAPRKKWPFLAAVPTDLAEESPKADEADATEADEDLAPTASEPATEADEAQAAPDAAGSVAASPATSAPEVASMATASEPHGGAVTLCVLAGLSLPALVAMAGSLAPRRRPVALLHEPDGLYEAF